MSSTADNFEVIGSIRGQMVLDAREAITRGVYDSPAIFDASLDAMIDRAESEERLAAAFDELRDMAFQRMTETDR